MKENQMGSSLSSLPAIAEELENQAYECNITSDAVITNIGNFVVALTIDPNSDLVITCKIAELGQVQEGKLTEFAFAALDANTRVSPFAFSIITVADDPDLTDEREYQIILTDKVPLGDLSECELRSAMNSLRSAIVGSREVLEAGGVGTLEPVAV